MTEVAHNHEAIILAGGLGTRLRSAVPDLPKCMAPVAGKPFLSYLIDYCVSQGVSKFIFSLGYRHEVIEQFLKETYPTLNYSVVIEQEPLGTGGGIQLACKKAKNPNVFILNGDTFFAVNFTSIATFHENNKSDCTLALKPMLNFNRYGVVETSNEGRVTAFHEKKPTVSGNINGGIYFLKVASLLNLQLPEKFSFEKDFMEKQLDHQHLTGIVQDGYFIDIGIPEDYNKAQFELTQL